MNCKLSSLCYSEASLVNFISVYQGIVYVVQFLHHCYADVWQRLLPRDFCFTHLYLKMQKVTSVTRGAECGGMFSLVTFSICGEPLHNSQRLDMYRLFFAISILKVSLKYIKMKWFQSLSLLCFWV